MIELGTIDLQPDNIIATKSFEYLVEETLDCHKGKCKTGCQSINVRLSISDLASASSGEAAPETEPEAEPNNEDGENSDHVDTPGPGVGVELMIQRSSICAVLFDFNACLVTVSTTDAH